MDPQNRNQQQNSTESKVENSGQNQNAVGKEIVYAIISDIHGNFEALREVLSEIKNSHEHIAGWFCLGDLVSYNPAPNECIEEVQRLNNIQYIAGNHDRASVDLLDITWFNHTAKRAITWTRKVLKKEHVQFLKSLKDRKKFTAAGKNIILAHGSPDPGHPFDYLLRPYDIQRIEPFLFGTDIIFVGHTHVPGYFQVSENRIHKFKGTGFGLDISLNPEEKYIVNAGSVGQPRDGISQASYVLYYPRQHKLEMKRTPYNITKVQEEIRESGLPGSLADRLAVGR